ncbi:MAG: pentapeptide repeat-containing protein [Candidatus Eisenbacteria sp.]|nr:pentapeptide repeat-containing protein [Candidatus Eisenbacteria bacterium]
MLRQAAHEICREADERRRTPWNRFVERLRVRALFQILGLCLGTIALGVAIVGGIILQGKADQRRELAQKNAAAADSVAAVDARVAKHFQAWITINTATGFPGEAGRKLALEELNQDSVPLNFIDLSRAWLLGVDLPSAQLASANLNSTMLVGANLSGANLAGAFLSEARLSGANLSEADLSGANLSGADLQASDLRETKLYRARLTNVRNWHLTWRIVNADLRGITMSSPDSARFINWARERGAICDPPPPPNSLATPEDATGAGG